MGGGGEEEGEGEVHSAGEEFFCADETKRKLEGLLTRIMAKLEKAREFRTWVTSEAERVGAGAREGLLNLRGR